VRRSWVSPDSDPDRKLILERPRVHRLPGEGRPVPAGPGDLGAGTDLQEELQLLLKERVVVPKLEPEERERLRKGAPSGYDLGAALERSPASQTPGKRAPGRPR